MSSPKSSAAPKAARKPAQAVAAEPSKSEKAAFLKAMMEGIKPGTLAAQKSAAKKQPGVKVLGKVAAVKAGPAKLAKPAAKKAAKVAAPADTGPKVELIRKISGAAGVPRTPESERAFALARELEAALADGRFDLIQPPAMQALMGALCKVYAANEDAGDRYPLLAGRAAVTGTDVMIVCGALLKAVDLQVFELGMWQSWAGR